MSVNIVLKDKNKTYLAVDSQITCGGESIIGTNINALKMWKVKGLDSCYMAHCGRLRDACAIRSEDLISRRDIYEGDIDFEYVVNYFVPNIVSKLEDAEFLKINNNYIDKLNSDFFLVYNDKAFSIDKDLSVVEIENYDAHGSGKYNALGSLASTVGLDPIERIKKAMCAGCNNIYVDFPIYIVDVENDNITKIGKEDL